MSCELVGASWLVITGVILFDQRGGADDVVCGCFAAGGLQGDAHRSTLPYNLLADGRGGRGLRPLAYLLLDDGAARAKLEALVRASNGTAVRG